MNKFGSFVLGLVVAGAIASSYAVGVHDGRDEVVASCANYGKYHLWATTDVITCAGPFDPKNLMPPEYVPYTKELKDKHRKDRK